MYKVNITLIMYIILLFLMMNWNKLWISIKDDTFSLHTSQIVLLTYIYRRCQSDDFVFHIALYLAIEI